MARCDGYIERCKVLVFRFPGRVGGRREWQSPEICDGVSMTDATQMWVEHTWEQISHTRQWARRQLRQVLNIG
jgi:hypothetical protein